MSADPKVGTAMSTELKTAVWTIDQFVYLAGEFLMANETVELRGKLFPVCTMQAVEAVVRQEYPVEEGVYDVPLWTRRHLALGHGPIVGHTSAWEQAVFPAFSGDYHHAHANYVCIMVAAAVEHRLDTDPFLANLRAISDARYEIREALTGE